MPSWTCSARGRPCWLIAERDVQCTSVLEEAQLDAQCALSVLLSDGRDTQCASSVLELPNETCSTRRRCCWLVGDAGLMRKPAYVTVYEQDSGGMRTEERKKALESSRRVSCTSRKSRLPR